MFVLNCLGTNTKFCLCFTKLGSYAGEIVTSIAQKHYKAKKESAASWEQKIKVETYNRLPRAKEEKPGRVLWEIRAIQRHLCLLLKFRRQHVRPGQDLCFEKT